MMNPDPKCVLTFRPFQIVRNNLDITRLAIAFFLSWLSMLVCIGLASFYFFAPSSTLIMILSAITMISLLLQTMLHVDFYWNGKFNPQYIQTSSLLWGMFFWMQLLFHAKELPNQYTWPPSFYLVSWFAMQVSGWVWYLLESQ
jgi:hypothetical protein